MDQSIQFDLDLIHRYDKAGPRYTSYPTALELHEGFTEADYRQQIENSNAAAGPLSLYFHLPFLPPLTLPFLTGKSTIAVVPLFGLLSYLISPPCALTIP